MSSLRQIFRGISEYRGRARKILFYLFAFCILAISLTFFVLRMEKPSMGVTLALSNQVWTVQSLDQDGSAIKAGIEIGDRPVEINGQPSELFLNQYTNVGVIYSISISELTVVNNNEQLKSINLETVRPSTEAVSETIAWLFTCATFWIIGFYVVYKKPKNTAAMLLCLCSLAFGLALSANLAVNINILGASPLGIIATLIGPFLLFHFFLILPDEQAGLRTNPFVYFIYLPAVITLILLPIIGLYRGQPLPLFRSVRLFESGIGFLAAISITVFNYFHFDSPKTRQQMKIVLFACMSTLIPYLVLYVLPLSIWKQGVFPSGLNMLFFALIPLGMGYAVITTRLLDIDVVIRRSIIYGLIATVIAIILSVAIFGVIALRASLSVAQQVALTIFLGVIATVLFGPVKRGFETLVDRLFYKDRYDYRLIIQSLSTSLNSVKELTDMSRLIVGTVNRTLNLAGGCLFMKTDSGTYELSANQGILEDMNKQERLRSSLVRSNIPFFPNSASIIDSDVAFLIPLVVEGKEVGVLCLSQKVTRQDFSSSDIFLLQGVASVAATALHGALLVKDISVRDTFISVASHELRTPVTSIMGYAELMLNRDITEDKRKQWLKNILDNSQRVSRIVDDLLNVSRIQSGKINLKKETVSLSEVLEDSLFLTKEYDQKHEFVIDIEPDLPPAVIDRDKFSQIIGNLLNNAIKYSPGGGRITVSAYYNKDQQQIIISISDQGIGISQEDAGSLFTTFHRIQRPETQGIRGTGLGLYIAKEWAEAMGGKIWLESKLNQGSTFFVSIPTVGVNARGNIIQQGNHD